MDILQIAVAVIGTAFIFFKEEIKQWWSQPR